MRLNQGLNSSAGNLTQLLIKR